MLVGIHMGPWLWIENYMNYYLKTGVNFFVCAMLIMGYVAWGGREPGKSRATLGRAPWQPCLSPNTVWFSCTVASRVAKPPLPYLGWWRVRRSSHQGKLHRFFNHRVHLVGYSVTCDGAMWWHYVHSLPDWHQESTKTRYGGPGNPTYQSPPILKTPYCNKSKTILVTVTPF